MFATLRIFRQYLPPPHPSSPPPTLKSPKSLRFLPQLSPPQTTQLILLKFSKHSAKCVQHTIKQLVRVEHICVCCGGGGERTGGVSLNPEILKCSNGVCTMLPLPDIQRGRNDAAGNTADIENARPPSSSRRSATLFGEINVTIFGWWRKNFLNPSRFREPTRCNRMSEK